MKLKSFVGVAAFSAALVACTSSFTFAATIVTANPYLSQLNIPTGFYQGGSPTFLEDFEDGNLGGGMTRTASTVIGPGGNTDSVDGDDGSINGSGTSGRSLFFGSGATGITFTFLNPVTAAALVWTDGAGSITFSAFNAIGTQIAILTLNGIPDGSISGTTAEDMFFGVTDPLGIKSIKISNSAGGIEVDHVQFGNAVSAVPVPAALPLLATGLGVFGYFSRRRKRRIPSAQ